MTSHHIISDSSQTREHNIITSYHHPTSPSFTSSSSSIITSHHLTDITPHNHITSSVIHHITSQTMTDTNETLPRKTRRTLAQLCNRQITILTTIQTHKIDPTNTISPTCPLCKTTEHTTTYLFNCTHIHTSLTPIDLWMDPVGVAVLLEQLEALLDR